MTLEDRPVTKSVFPGFSTSVPLPRLPDLDLDQERDLDLDLGLCWDLDLDLDLDLDRDIDLALQGEIYLQCLQIRLRTKTLPYSSSSAVSSSGFLFFRNLRRVFSPRADFKECESFFISQLTPVSFLFFVVPLKTTSMYDPPC